MITNIDSINNPSWQEESNCKDQDPAIWFETVNKKIAKKICGNCTVAAQCLDWILTLEKGGHTTARSGVYAGTTPRERSRIKICLYSDCTKRVTKHKSFCSDEHREAQKQFYQRNKKETPTEYHAKGRVPNYS